MNTIEKKLIMERILRFSDYINVCELAQAQCGQKFCVSELPTYFSCEPQQAISAFTLN